MKKKYIIMIVIALIIVIGVASFMIYKQMVKNGREYEIEKINVDDYEYFIVEIDNKYGVIDRTGNTVVAVQYDNVIIPDPRRALFICYEGENTKILNQNQEQILTEYTNIRPIRLKNIASDIMYEKNILTYEQEGKVGLIDLDGNILAKPIYDSIEGLPYKEGELLVKIDEKYGVINNRGNVIVDTQYDQISIDNYTTEENGYKKAGYVVSNTTEDGYRYGYIDYNGDIILETEYNDISRIFDIKDDETVYLITGLNGQYGILKNGEQVIANEYQSISYNTESNTLTLEKTKRYGVASLEGETIIPVEYTQIDSTGMYIYATSTNGEVQVYQKNGERANIESNISILETENENYKIKIDSTQGTKYSIIDSQNNELTTNEYSYIGYLFDDYFIVSISGGKLGVIDVNETPIIEIKYDSIENLQGTDYIVATLTQEGITQVYDKSLNKICEMSNAIIDTHQDYIKIYNTSETKYFDLNGNEKQNTEIFDNQIYAKSQNGKWGFVDKSGNVVIDYIYDKVTDLNEYGYAGIKVDNKWGVVNSNGEIILEPAYELNTEEEPEFINQYYKVEYGYGEFYYTK